MAAHGTQTLAILARPPDSMGHQMPIEDPSEWVAHIERKLPGPQNTRARFLATLTTLEVAAGWALTNQQIASLLGATTRHTKRLKKDVRERVWGGDMPGVTFSESVTHKFPANGHNTGGDTSPHPPGGDTQHTRASAHASGTSPYQNQINKSSIDRGDMKPAIRAFMDLPGADLSTLRTLEGWLATDQCSLQQIQDAAAAAAARGKPVSYGMACLKNADTPSNPSPDNEQADRIAQAQRLAASMTAAAREWAPHRRSLEAIEAQADREWGARWDEQGTQRQLAPPEEEMLDWDETDKSEQIDLQRAYRLLSDKTKYPHLFTPNAERHLADILQRHGWAIEEGGIVRRTD